MTRRTARGLGRRGGRAAPRRARPRRWRARLRGWLGPALLMLAAGGGLAAVLWRSRPAGETLDGRGLGGSDRQRAMTPLSRDAREWLVTHRGEVLRVAGSFDVSPVALGGIVAVEKTLLTGTIDVLGEEVFRTVFGALRDEDLGRWARGQEREYQRRLARGGGRPTLLTPYLWTLGPAQVSFRLAILHEPQVARRLGRPERGVREVLGAVSTTPGNLEYAAALLADAQRAYADVAGVDITADPGLLATLYQLGSPGSRARRLAADNRARATRGAAPVLPRMNWYGAFVDRHAAEIAELLELPPPAARDLSASAARSPGPPAARAWRT